MEENRWKWKKLEWKEIEQNRAEWNSIEGREWKRLEYNFHTLIPNKY